ncbi:MAG TPA: hypothetical protein VNQ99_13275 [Xanthobacteraceae bacterium]|nr:hypothetical protein [Xanthobacteraceae bacterium]
MAKAVWRWQCDLSGDDPTVVIYAGEVVDGATRMDTSNPYRIKMSELTSLADLTDIETLDAIVAARPVVPPFPIQPPAPEPEE